MESGVKEMSNYLDAKISVTISSSGGGKLSIPFNSEQDFQRIKNLLK